MAVLTDVTHPPLFMIMQDSTTFFKIVAVVCFFNHNKVFAFLCILLAHLSPKRRAILSSLDRLVWSDGSGSPFLFLSKRKKNHTDGCHVHLTSAPEAAYKTLCAAISHLPCKGLERSVQPNLCSTSILREWATQCCAWKWAGKHFYTQYTRIHKQRTDVSKSHHDDSVDVLCNALWHLCCDSRSLLWLLWLWRRKRHRKCELVKKRRCCLPHKKVPKALLFDKNEESRCDGWSWEESTVVNPGLRRDWRDG